MLLSFGWVEQAVAQCGADIDLGPDTIICQGAAVELDAGPGFQSYLWENGSTQQTRFISVSGTYTCTTTDFGTSGELVVNGNFDAGATGFTSGYSPGTGGSYGLLSDPGTYTTTTNPNSVHVNFASFGDHTTGSGSMLVMNGSDQFGLSVWCQTVAVQPNTDYAFSAWLATAFSASPAEMVFTVNSTTVGAPLLATLATGEWLNFYSIWNSGASTTADICIINQNVSSSGNDFALDDISFSPFCTYTDEITITVQDFPQPDLGADLELCEGTAVTLDATWPNADTYSWQDNSSGTTFNPMVSGTYWVDVTVNGCTARDSVEVLFQPQPAVDLGPSQELCMGDTVVLDATSPGATYLWQDGSTLPMLAVTTSGQYSVVLDIDGCIATGTVNVMVYPYPVVDLGPDTAICEGNVLALDAYSPGGSYLWDDGSATPLRTLVASGTYWVRVTENGCATTDSLQLEVIPLPFVDLGPDLLLCTGTTQQLDVGSPGLSYLWFNGDTTATYVIEEAGMLNVTVSNSCGTMFDDLVVTEDQCDCPVYVPNTFTPNADEVNDVFRPVFDCPVSNYALQIFDRWGTIIWKTNDPKDGWSADEAISSGIYAWRLTITPVTVYDRTSRTLIGHVVVLR